MSRQKFTIEEIVEILSAEKKSSVAGVCRKHGISASTFYRWRERYAIARDHSGAYSLDIAKKLEALEAENAALKKALAEKELEYTVLREFIEKNDLEK